MTKEFIPYDAVRNNGIKLAVRIFREFGVPDIIYVSLRGGAALGNILSEFLQILSPVKKVLYAAVVAKSYHDVFRSNEVVTVEGWTRKPQLLKKGQKVLLVDDIFDTGRTINRLVPLILENGLQRKEIAVTVHDYKIRTYESRMLPVHPDFYCRRHIIERPEDDFWIHYLSHELKSLSDSEIEDHYINADPELTAAFAFLKCHRAT